MHIILGKANPERMNGVNKVVHELASQQAAAGYRISVWGITSSLSHDYPARNFKTVLFKSSRISFHIPRQMLTALDSCSRPTVFHLHGGFIPVFYALSKALAKRKLPFIITGHGSYNAIAMKKSHLAKKIYFHFFEKKLLRRSRYIHSLGKSEAAGLNELYPNNKSITIPYGFSIPREPEKKLSTDKFIIGYCGRLDVHTKGLHELLEAFALFKKAVPGSELWIIGDSSEKEKLKSVADQLNINESVIFWGSKFGAEKIQLLQQLKIFALPSRNEGLPAAVLEAASLSIPCLVTEATNLGDSVRQYQCGQVIMHTDAREISSALVKLYADMQNGCGERMKVNANRMVTESYSWKNILQQYTSLYNKAS